MLDFHNYGLTRQLINESIKSEQILGNTTIRVIETIQDKMLAPATTKSALIGQLKEVVNAVLKNISKLGSQLLLEPVLNGPIINTATAKLKTVGFLLLNQLYSISVI